MKIMRYPTKLICAALLLSGCAMSYSWRPKVPENYRTVTVPTFRNESNIMEAGATMTTQLKREFQRDGVFKLAAGDSGALEVQGTVNSIISGLVAYDRRASTRISAYGVKMTVTVSVIDKKRGRVLINNKTYSGDTTTAYSQDSTTAMRDAAGRAADDVSRQIVDDLTAFDYNKAEWENEDHE